MHEPSLFEGQTDTRLFAYRFLWLRSFHHPVSIRMVIQGDGQALVTTKIADGAGGYEPGRLISNTSRYLTKEQTSFFVERIAGSGFWDAPTREVSPGVVNLDGAEWIFEGVKDGKYHVLDRWSPKEGPMHDIGIMMLIDVAKLKLLYQDVY